LALIFDDHYKVTKVVTNKIVMSRTKNNQKNSVPQWQSDKMKTLIAERWQEIWQIVETRNRDSNPNSIYT
jgi:hypothetical protein